MEANEIECRGVAKFFGGSALLKSINLKIPQAETFVLIGPSGHGKSVFLKMLCGLLEPSEGQILHQGQNLYDLPERLKNQKMQRIGMLFQKNALFDSLTCSENIAFPLRELTALSQEDIGEKVEHF